MSRPRNWAPWTRYVPLVLFPLVIRLLVFVYIAVGMWTGMLEGISNWSRDVKSVSRQLKKGEKE